MHALGMQQAIRLKAVCAVSFGPGMQPKNDSIAYSRLSLGLYIKVLLTVTPKLKNDNAKLPKAGRRALQYHI